MNAAGRLLKAALMYAERFGFAVFPCHSITPDGACSCGASDCKSPGKHPLTKHGVKDATKDPSQIRAWWKRSPDANLAIATGAASGITVLDVDPRHSGDETLAELEAKYGTFPDTPTVLTGGGGIHCYFKHPAGVLVVSNSAGKIGPGIDVRADGGYVIAPPSVHANGNRYLWEVSARIDEAPLAEVPRWLLDLNNAASGNGAPSGFNPPPVFKDGSRNDYLYRTARSAHQKYRLGASELLALLRGVNETRCQPPVGEAELRKIAHNASTQADAPGFKVPTENQRLAAELAELERIDPIAFALRKREVAKQLGISAREVQQAVAQQKRLERSNGSAEKPTGTGTSGPFEGCSNSIPVRMPDELYTTAGEIVEAPDVLALVRDTVKGLGYAGDPTPVLLTYVSITSRLQEKPINQHLVAQAASGKNFVVNTALLLIPDEAVIKMTASSPKALIYGADDLRHKTVILAECDSIRNLEGSAASLVRSIIEDDRTDFDTVERDPETGRNSTRRVSKEGPTGLITTGVRELEFQMGTRMLVVHLSDSPEQTRAVLQAEAATADGTAPAPDPKVLGRFKDYQRWLALQAAPSVIVPYASILAAQVPAAEVRMRRDFKQLVAIIKAIALLNQQHREHTEPGAIIADFADYAWARTLILSAFRSIVGGGITDAIRETCLAVPEGDAEMSEADLVRSLNLSKSTVHYRVGRALRGGWLTNLEKRRGYPFRLSRGGPLPEDASPLPTVEQLREEFEHLANSNGHSNGPQTIGRERELVTPFECSNENRGAVDDDAIDLIPDETEGMCPETR